MKSKQKKKWLVALLIFTLIGAVGCVKEPDVSTLKVKEDASPTPKMVKHDSTIELINGANGELTIASIEQGRNLQLYDQGGHCNCSKYGRLEENVSPEEKDKQVKAELAKARQFIWEHWQNKKRGYIRLTFTGIDAATTTHFFIEPELDNKWVISRRAVNWHAVMPVALRDLEKIFQVRQQQGKRQQLNLIFENSEGIKIDTL